MENLVQYSIREGIATVTLDNPPMNVLNQCLRKQLADMLQNLDARDDLRALILTGGGGRAFCAGADLKETSNLTEETVESFWNELQGVFERLTHFSVPTIAAVDGYALGGGCHLALCCDIRLVSPNTVFGAVAANLGLAYSSQALVRLVGPARAKEMAFTARRVGAEEAERIGLCNHVVISEQLMEECHDTARQIANKPPSSIRYIKSEMDQATELMETEMRELERQHFLELHQTADHQEAIRAIIEKRSPDFRNR